MADIERLLAALNRLVDQGNTVAVIEHNADVIKIADHIIDMGPEGGQAGGYLVGEGTPETIATMQTATGSVLRQAFSDTAVSVLPNDHFPSTQVSHNDIRLKGTRTHNLKNLDVTFPQGKMTVVTGVSGSGKTSLAFHTLFAEGQPKVSHRPLPLTSVTAVTIPAQRLPQSPKYTTHSGFFTRESDGRIVRFAAHPFKVTPRANPYTN